MQNDALTARTTAPFLGIALVLCAASALAVNGAAKQEPVQDPADGVDAGAREADDEREPLRLRYLANEGFLVEVGEHAVLFDAFVATPYAGYPSMPEELVAKLRRAEEPFAGIDLALTSHAHADHFQERVARDFLAASPETAFATTPQALDALEEVTDDFEALEERLHGHYPKAGKSKVVEFDELKVRYLRIPHGGQPKMQNLGTLLEIGGHRVLHLGDADVDREIFEPYAELLEDVELALVPFWFHGSKEGRAIVQELLPAKAHVAMHFPKRGHAEVVKSFLENHEGVHAFSEPLQEKTYE